jgi:hypothetical protein
VLISRRGPAFDDHNPQAVLPTFGAVVPLGCTSAQLSSVHTITLTSSCLATPVRADSFRVQEDGCAGKAPPRDALLEKDSFDKMLEALNDAGQSELRISSFISDDGVSAGAGNAGNSAMSAPAQSIVPEQPHWCVIVFCCFRLLSVHGATGIACVSFQLREGD